MLIYFSKSDKSFCCLLPSLWTNDSHLQHQFPLNENETEEENISSYDQSGIFKYGKMIKAKWNDRKAP